MCVCMVLCRNVLLREREKKKKREKKRRRCAPLMKVETGKEKEKKKKCLKKGKKQNTLPGVNIHWGASKRERLAVTTTITATIAISQ